MVVGQFGIQTNRTACYCTHHLICALMAMSIFVCKLFFSHITTNEPKTYTQRHTHTFFSIASRQNCNSAENDLLAFINQVISRAHCNTRIPNGLHTMTHIGAILVRCRLPILAMCFSISASSNDTCSQISITFIINVNLFDCFSYMYVYFVCIFLSHFSLYFADFFSVIYLFL